VLATKRVVAPTLPVLSSRLDHSMLAGRLATWHHVHHGVGIGCLTKAGEHRAVLAAVPHGVVRLHIADTLRHLGTLQFEVSVAELNRLAYSIRPIAALLYLDGSYDQGDATRWIAQVRQLRATWTMLPIIGYAPVTAKGLDQGTAAIGTTA
jgi:hypothetical protein